MKRSALLVVAVAVVAGFGCDSSPGGTGDDPPPTLVLSATNSCGKNILPVPTREQLQSGTYETMTVSVRGVDLANSSGTFTGGTPVELFVAKEDTPADAEGSADVLGDEGIGWFLSALDEGADAPKHISAGIKFTGDIARDSFFCTKSGTARLFARVLDYQPGGSGEIQDVYTNRGFPVRCAPKAVYEAECGQVNDAFVDVAFDMGPDSDASDAEAGMDAERIPTWAINYLPLNPGEEVIGIQGSGGGRPDQVELKFQVTEFDQPLAGVEVRFELPEQRPPNVEVDPSSATTDENGIASVRLKAGGTPGVVSVRATATRLFERNTPEGGCAEAAECVGMDPVCRDEICYERQRSESRSQTVVIRGGIPSHRGMQLVCEYPVLPGFTRRVASDDRNVDDHWGIPSEPGTDCSVQLADRVNGMVDTQVQVFFLTEAGVIRQAAPVDEAGIATTHLRINEPHPFDTDPEPWEVELGFDGAYNPRDGLVRIVAVTRGEEDFVDVNGDKIFDDAEDFQHPWQQLSDPFIDANDNGEADLGTEEFRDGDNSGDFTFPNAEWDNDVEIWTSANVLWVGDLVGACANFRFACAVDRDGQEIPGCQMQTLRDGTVLTDVPPIINQPLGAFTATSWWRDDNGNCPAGRDVGSIQAAAAGSWVVGGLNPIETRDLCFHGPGGQPYSPDVTWTFGNRYEPTEDELLEEDELNFTYNHQAVLGRAVRGTCTFLVQTRLAALPPPQP